jgi:hypothetical protein
MPGLPPREADEEDEEVTERRAIVKVCEWCGGEYTTIPSHADRRRYCSVECAGKGRRHKCESRRKCPNCGKMFVIQSWNPKLTCSKKCANAMKMHRVTKRCEICGKEYEVNWCRRKKSRYCSVECLARAKRKVMRRPTKEQLAALLVHNTLSSIGKMYGVTFNTVRFWAKQYGLSWPNKAERNRLQALKTSQRDRLVDELLTEDCQHSNADFASFDRVE